MNFPPSPAQAQCALHPTAAATLTCARCGNFMCAECSDQGLATLCPACRKLTGVAAFPFTRDDFDFGRLWEHVFELWKREWLMVSVAVLVFMLLPSVVIVPIGAVAGMAQVLLGAMAKDPAAMTAVAIAMQLVTFGLSFAAQAVVQLGLSRVMLDALTGRPIDVGRMFSQLPKVWRAIGVTLLFGLVVFLVAAAPMVAFVGAVFAKSSPDAGLAFGALGSGTIVLLLVAFVFTFIGTLVWTIAIDELAYADCGAIEAVKRAWALLDGMKMRGLGYLFVGFLVAFVGFLACCVGMLPALGLTHLLTTGFFLCLRFGSGLPAPANPT